VNIILIGYRCSGKTSVGKRLARKQGWSFVDTDDRLTEKAGRSVKDIVEESGWEGFRRMEWEVVQAVCEQDNTVIATGGGAVLDPDSVAAMQKSGRVVWLKVSPQTAKQRMTQDRHTDEFRPSLTSQGLYDEIAAVLAERAPLYEQAMDVSIDTDNKAIDEIVDEIINGFKVSRSQGVK
jgi:shikimate kinase